jgi:hypothetical protein
MQLCFLPNHWYLFFPIFEYIHFRIGFGTIFIKKKHFPKSIQVPCNFQTRITFGENFTICYGLRFDFVGEKLTRPQRKSRLHYEQAGIKR